MNHRLQECCGKSRADQATHSQLLSKHDLTTTPQTVKTDPTIRPDFGGWGLRNLDLLLNSQWLYGNPQRSMLRPEREGTRRACDWDRARLQ